MAVDEAIMRAVGAALVLPTLRFYAWNPPSLSLGRSQSAEDADVAALQAAGFGLVRRPTGGKAILHIDELTYSIVAPEDEPRVAGGIVESYRQLSAGLVRGLERLGAAGVEADRRVERQQLKGPVCFEVPSDYEITVGGRKLVGSAQMRSQGVVLQHGALPLCGDIARICLFLATHPDQERVRARATTLSAVLGRSVTWQEAADAVTQGCAEALDLQFEVGALIPTEQTWAEELQSDKYQLEQWTRRA